MRYGRVVIVKGIEQGTTPLPDFRSEERICRVIVQQDDTVYTTDNLPHVTSAAINLPWSEAAQLRVGQRAYLSLDVYDAAMDQEPARMVLGGYGKPVENV